MYTAAQFENTRREIRYLRQENARLKRKIARLIETNKQLQRQNHDLRIENQLLKKGQHLMVEKQHQQEKELEGLKLIIEELRAMVFGKKKKKDDENSNSSGETFDINTQSEQTNKRRSVDRTPDSYRRAAPQDTEVTETYGHPITNCPDCGTVLIQLKQIIRYIEDIADLPNLSNLLKIIEKHIIGSGYCPKCKRRRSAKEISPQVSILGENVKKFIAYLIIVMRLSFDQVKCFMADTANFAVSDGEIASSLHKQAEKLTTERDRLLTLIRGAPGRHYDETEWRVQKEGQGNYCWINRPTIGEETVFLMGRSRGKGNALELQGVVDNQVGISDDYAAYQNMFAKHQLCMSHPQRKLRDLSESKTLRDMSKKICAKSYSEFSSLYENLGITLASEYQKDLWLQKREEYVKRLKEIALITKDDPEKLKTIKESLKDNAENYFTCLLQPGIPADNNKAERGLRHIVLKRKISYGSKSQKGADTMAILCSTLLSAWWNKPKNFFVAYNQMLTA